MRARNALLLMITVPGPFIKVIIKILTKVIFVAQKNHRLFSRELLILKNDSVKGQLDSTRGIYFE
ncbi:MAG: hypothetical protein GY757_21195 [bacterium]|nr:hypothetical protein [bacterium]